jgi:hypothetical protein
MKATAQAVAQATIDVTFERVRRIAETTPKRQATELKAPTYGKWVVGNNDAAVEMNLTDQGQSTGISVTMQMPKAGAGMTWGLGILSPIVMPLLYLQLRRNAKSMAKTLKTQAENEMLTARQKLSESGAG